MMHFQLMLYWFSFTQELSIFQENKRWGFVAKLSESCTIVIVSNSEFTIVSFVSSTLVIALKHELYELLGNLH